MKTGSDVRATEIARDRTTRQAASVPPRPTTAPHPLLVLQRKVGNQAVTTIIVTENDAAVQRDPSPIRDDYTHVDVTSAGAEITDSGEFAGLSADEFNEAKLRLRGQGKAFTVAAARIEMLRPKVIQAWDRLQTEKGHLGAGAQALGVFTAPEWFFKKPGIPFIASDKDRIIEAFRSLSEQYTELVLVPGTIVWSDGDGKSLRIRNTAFVVLNGHLVKTTDKVGDFGDTDSYFYRKADPSTHELPPKSEITAAWNRGRTPADNKSVPDDPSAFRVGNVTFSVEICGDFGRAKQDQALGRAPASGIDVQILVSHGSTLAGGMVITKPGGVALHNDATSGGVRARREAKVSALPGGIAPAPTTQSIVQGDAAIDDLHLPPVPLPANTPAARRARAAVYLDRMKTIVHALRTSWDQLAGTVKGDVTARKDEYRQAVEAGGADSDGARNARGRLMQAEIMKGAASKAKSWLPGLDKRAQALPQGGTLTSATAPKAVAKAISIASDASRRYDKLANEARDFQVGAELAVTARALQELHEEGLAG